MRNYLLFLRMRYLRVTFCVVAGFVAMFVYLWLGGLPSAGWLVGCIALVLVILFGLLLWTSIDIGNIRKLFVQKVCTFSVHESSKYGKVQDSAMTAVYCFIERYPWTMDKCVLELLPAPDIKPMVGEPADTRYARIHMKFPGGLWLRWCEDKSTNGGLLNMVSINHKDIHYMPAAGPVTDRVLDHLKANCK